MASMTEQLKVIISADAKGFSSALNSMSSSLGKTKKDFEGLSKVGEGMQSVGKKLTAGLTVPIVGVGVASAKMASDFGKQMSNVTTLLGGTTQEAKARTEELKKSVLSLSNETGVATETLASGLYEVVSAFGDTAESAKILEVATKGSKAGMAEVSDTVKLLSAVTKGYGDTSVEANQKVSDMAFTAVKLGQTTFPELATSMGKVIPIASELGVAQEELFGVMATATGVTGNASEVTTQLRGVMQSLTAPTKAMSGLMSDLGYENGKAMLSSLGLQGTIDKIVESAEASGTPLQQYIGSIEGQTLALALAGAQSDNLTEKTKAMYDAVGATDEAYQRATDTVGERFSNALNQAKNSLIILGDALAPLIEKVSEFISWIAEWISKFAELNPATQNFILIVAGILALLGPLIGLIGGCISVFVGLSVASTVLGVGMLPLIGIIVGIIAVIGLLVGAGIWLCQNWDKVKAVGEATWNWICDVVTSTVGSMVQFTLNSWEAVTNFLSNCWNNLKTWASEKFSAIATTISEKWNNAKTWTSEKWQSITSWLGNHWSNLKSTCSEKFSNVVTTISDKWEDAKKKTSDKWENIKRVVSNGVEKLKGFMNFKWELPKLKMPHFSVSGKFSLNPPSVPKMNVSWYSKGGIFKRPTVIGGMGVGDAHNGIGSNAEAVLPLDKLPELLGLDKNSKGVTIQIDNFVNNTKEDVNDLTNRIAFELKRRKVVYG